MHFTGVSPAFLLLLPALVVLIVCTNANPTANLTQRGVATAVSDKDKTWDDWVVEGRALACLMRAASSEEAQAYYTSVTGDHSSIKSSFTEVEQLEGSGWKKVKHSEQDMESDDEALGSVQITSYEQINGALELGRLFEGEEHLRDGKDEHNQYNRYSLTLKNVRSQQKGEAVEEYIMNPEKHGIVLKDLDSPAHMAAAAGWEKEDAAIPELKRVSDVTFLAWKDACLQPEEDNEPKVRQLHWAWAADVKSIYTRYVLAKAFEMEGWNMLLDYETTLTERGTITPESDAGSALIASPIGRMLAWMLIQHKEELGAKRISGVIVCGEDGEELKGAIRAFPNGEQVKGWLMAQIIFLIEDVEIEG